MRRALLLYPSPAASLPLATIPRVRRCHRWVAAEAALWILSGAAWCQPPPAPAEPQAGPVKPEVRAVLEGQVLDAKTGAPVARVNLELIGDASRDPPASATAGPDGRFTIPDVAPGRYRLFLERRGYVRQAYGGRSMQQAAVLSLSPGQKLRVDAKLVPQAVIAGKIVDEDGEALAGVQVRALRIGYARSVRGPAPEGWASTNDLGEFRLHSLPPGRYYLQAVYTPGDFNAPAPAAGAGSSEPVLGYVPTFYPGVKDPATAVPLEAVPGAEIRGIQFAVAQAQTYRIRGRVWNAVTGRVERNTMVMLVPRSRDLASFAAFRNTTVDGKGNFELRGIQPGLYYVIARWFGEGGRNMARQAVDVTNSDVEGVEVVLGQGADIPGSVRAEGEGAVDTKKLSVFFRPADPAGFMMMPASANVEDDGSFVVRKVMPGEYLVQLMGMPKDFYVKSVRLGDQEVLDSGFTVESGGAPGALEVVLSAGAGRLDGLVLGEDDKALPGATVVLLPEPERRKYERLVKSSACDQNGRFTLEGIPPGEYKLFAWKEVETGAWLDPDFMQPIEKLGEEVAIREAGRESRQLKAMPAGQ